MNREQLEHSLRAAGQIINENSFIVIGSQSVLGAFPTAPPELLYSMEVDLIPKNNKSRTHELEAIGEMSRFSETHGYYVDPVSEGTAILPRGWKGRLVNVQNENTGNVLGLCLNPADLVVAKVAAGREKDIEFVKAMIAHGMVDRARVCQYASTIPCPMNDLTRSRRVMSNLDRLFEEHCAMPTKEANEASGRYTGTVLNVGLKWVRQDIGRGESVLHLADNLNKLPEVGKSVTVQYKEGKGIVSTKERMASLSR